MNSLVEISRRLAEALSPLEFAAPVTHVYNPLVYARAMHEAYLERFGTGSKEVLMLGMNPGPWGMAQTGVPFGEVASVRDWMGLEAEVGKPEREHPKRPIEGLACSRSEVSGRRLWGLAASKFESADAFFERFFVYNYCPLSFMESSGRNRTPDKLPVHEREPLEALCDQALAQVIEALNPSLLIGVGLFAEKRLARVAGDRRVGRILHPSPASPAANRGWQPQAEAQLAALGIDLPG